MDSRTLIRQARFSDADAMLALLRELFGIEADFAFDAERQRRGLAMLLRQPETACLLAAEHAGRVVGMGSCQMVVSTAEGGLSGLVEDVVVDEHHRNQGLGLRLVRALESWAAARGATRLQLLADAHNDSALRFYARAGWRPTRLVCLRRLPAPLPAT
jgi:ribosomal protein S18 acetylase RimI-like enzyme